MRRISACLTFCLLLGSLAWAQIDSAVSRGTRLSPQAPEPGPVLSTTQLARQPVYKSLEKALHEPGQVYKLDLSGQRLRRIPADVGRLVNLQVLNLSDNRLTELPEVLFELSNLQVLVLTDNKLRTLPDHMREMKNLTRLYVGENRIMEMPAWVGGLAKLRYIDLHGNYITLYEVEKLRSVLRHCEIGY